MDLLGAPIFLLDDALEVALVGRGDVRAAVDPAVVLGQVRVQTMEFTAGKYLIGKYFIGKYLIGKCLIDKYLIGKYLIGKIGASVEIPDWVAKVLAGYTYGGS